MKCFKTELFGIESYLFCKTAGKAKAATLNSALDAGYSNAKFMYIKCHRAKNIDGMGSKLRPNTPYSLETILK